MNTVSIRQIVDNILLKRGYSNHWTLDFLVPATDCLRELSFDINDLLPVKYKVLPLNDNHAIEIPNDYTDWTKLAYRVGQFLKPLVEDPALDLVPNFDSNFDIQPYNQGIASDPTNPNLQWVGYSSPYWWTINWNSFGENLGRQYGGQPSYTDTFRVNKARNEIKINENLNVNEIVLEYIGNGMDVDSATYIDGYAQMTIETYAIWQFKANNRTYSPSEVEMAKQEYITEREILVARKSDLTIDRLRRIVQSNSVAVKY